MTNYYTATDRVGDILVQFVLDTSTDEFYLTLESVAALAGMDEVLDVYRLSFSGKFRQTFGKLLIEAVDAIDISSGDLRETLEVLPVDDAIAVIFYEYWTASDKTAFDTIELLEGLSAPINALHTFKTYPYSQDDLDTIEGYLEEAFDEAIMELGEDAHYAGP